MTLKHKHKFGGFLRKIARISMKNLVILKMTSFSSEGLCLEHFSGYGNFSSQKRNRNRWKRQDPSNTDLSNLILVEHYLNDLAHKL